MTIDVCIPHPPEGGFLDALRDELTKGVRLVDGPCHVLVAGVPDDALLAASPDLRAVVIPYAGVPARTRDLLRTRPDVTLHNLHHNAAPTAETAIALFLAAAKSIVPIDRALRRHDWTPRYAERRSLLCEGRTALVVGHGAIGQRIALACRGLGMDVIAMRRDDASALQKHLARADALFVCVPWTPATEGLLGAAELGLLRDGAVIVNVARGPIIDEAALFAELASGRLAAGLDVWYRYPKTEEERAHTPPSEHPFHELDNVVMSPHRAGHCDKTERLRAGHLAALLNAAARGEELPNRVDLERGY